LKPHNISEERVLKMEQDETTRGAFAYL
jgi:hypothetical protein